MIFNCSLFDGNHCSELGGSGHSSEERAVVAAAYDMSGAKKMLYSYRIVKRIMVHIALAALLQQFLPNFDHGEGVKFTVT